MKWYAVISHTALRERIYRKLIGWTFDPERAAISSSKPSLSIAEVGVAVEVRSNKDLAARYPRGKIE